MIKLPSIPNLTSSAVEFVCPWEYQGNIPDDVRGPKAKALRLTWQQDPTTSHNFFSGWEGLNDSSRVSDKDDANPPYKLHAIVADYDAPLTDAEISSGLERMGNYLPAYFGRSLSGNVHAVWLLESPVIVPTGEFAVEFLRALNKRLPLDRFGVRLDGPALTRPGQYYCNGCQWYSVSDYRLPKSLVQGWLVETAEKFNFRSEGIRIPLDVAWVELQKLWPQATWPGDFVEGSQGPSFFIEGSTSPKSAILKPEGIYTFSEHATKPWWSWRDLLGAQFVDGFESKSIGGAVENIYFDGRNYWREDGNGRWAPYAKEDTAAHLFIARDVPKSAAKGQASMLDKCLEHVRQWQRVDGACPFVFRPSGPIRSSGAVVLNTFTRRAAVPADFPVKWGDPSIGFITWLVDGLLASPDQLDYLLSWLHHFYVGAHNFDLQSGQNIFLVGGPGAGKTLFSTRLIAPLVGGHVTAEDYLMGNTTFNSQLFESAYWTIDDNLAATDVASHRRFSTLIKRMAANTTFEYHAKFQTPVQVSWRGRVCVTMNADEESIRMLPDLDISILDKICLFKASDQSRSFPSSTEVERSLRQELPAFARFLLDYQVPDHCRGGSRYGITSYHEPSLIRTANHSSRTFAFAELIDDWRREYFEENTNDWMGSAYQLLYLMNKDPARAATMRSLNNAQMSSQLAALKNRGYPIECEETDHGRTWIVRRNP